MNDDSNQPMESPAPMLAVIAALAVIVLGALMVIDTLWLATDPSAVASQSSPATDPPPPG